MIYIKEWFLKKMDLPEYAIAEQEVEIIKETEKAYFVGMPTWTIDGETPLYLKVWVPKKCTMTKEEYDKSRDEEFNRFIEGCDRYEKLLQFCKENKVRGARKGLRKETLLRKISEAGLEYVY